MNANLQNNPKHLGSQASPRKSSSGLQQVQLFAPSWCMSSSCYQHILLPPSWAFQCLTLFTLSRAIRESLHQFAKLQDHEIETTALIVKGLTTGVHCFTSEILPCIRQSYCCTRFRWFIAAATVQRHCLKKLILFVFFVAIGFSLPFAVFQLKVKS